MKYQYLVSKQAEYLLKSQKDLLPEKFNKSQAKKRIKDEVNKAFNTFKLILDSEALDDDYKADVFSCNKISTFLNDVRHYSHHDTKTLIENKQAIAEDMIKYGLQFYKFRFEGLTSFKKQFSEFEAVIQDFRTVSSIMEKSNESLKVKKTRKAKNQ